ncbi:hypothetical protein SEUCBS139899_009335 [Sporothrix eucalyptigena]|uniref:ATP-dependent RNA helicase n=1 Tax=Sporothrix eucalyptigena TaxID=1812306 RepID=A0ABP0AXT7_9PEZI
MFRTAVLRAARLPRAAGVSSSSIVAGLRNVALPTTRSMAQTAALQSRAVPALLQVAQFARYYSDNATATATAESSVQTESETASSGLITRFADLNKLGVHENLIKNLTQNLGYETMTPVQSMTISPALAGKDMVAQAKTGTGKTLAFLIPLIQRMIIDQPALAYRNRTRASASDIRAIIMSPTRELAEQIGEEARKLVRNTGIVVQTAVGGTHKASMLRRTKIEGCHLLVATPGRLNDILSSDSEIGAPNLSALVLDEADRMLDVGFDRELREILRYLPDRSKVPRQTLMFSATMSSNIVQLARSYVDRKNFEFVQTINPDDTLTHEKVPQHLVAINSYENYHPTLLELIQREAEKSREEGAMPFKAVVFLGTNNFVQLTQSVFYSVYKDGVQLPRMYHINSKLSQQQRTRAADDFRNARSAILFSSDVTARGMDFPNVSHVIQVGIPPDREQYIHRLGRTGRADKLGQGWLLVARNELSATHNMLGNLPIKRTEGFASADYDMSIKDAIDEPKAITAISATIGRIPPGLMKDTYLSFFGGAANGRSMQAIGDNANGLALNGWGFTRPPPISEAAARKRGLHKVRGMNIQAEGQSQSGYGSGRRGYGSNQFDNSLDGDDDFAREFAQKAVGSGSGRQNNQFGGRGGSGFDREYNQTGSRRDRGRGSGGYDDRAPRRGGRDRRDGSRNHFSNNRSDRRWSSRLDDDF